MIKNDLENCEVFGEQGLMKNFITAFVKSAKFAYLKSLFVYTNLVFIASNYLLCFNANVIARYTV